MKKKSLCTAFGMVLAMSGTCAFAFTPGTYEGVGQGLYGKTRVSVEVTKDRIQSIKVLSSDDTHLMINAAEKDTVPRILESQTTGVDASSGATFASFSIKGAVADALKKAGGDPSVYTKRLPKVDKMSLPDEEADIVVVGGGAAGLAAAAEAAKVKGLRVVLLEKSCWTGGSAALSGGSLAVGGTELNKQDGAKNFNTEEWVTYFKKRANDATSRPEGLKINEELVRKIGDVAPDVINAYLKERLHFTTHYTTAYFGTGRPYSHNMKGAGPDRGIEAFKDGTPRGNENVFADFMTNLAKKHGADIRINSKVTKLLPNNEGVVVETPKSTYTLRAKKVILATGGIAQDREMFTKLNAHVKNIDKAWSYTNGGATGDGFKLTATQNPATTGYGFIAIAGVREPYGFENDLAWVPEEFTFLWVTDKGERFADVPNNYYYHLGLDILNKAGGHAWAITSPTKWGRYGKSHTFDDWLKLADKAGQVYVKADSIEELAQSIGANPETLLSSVKTYNQEVKGKNIANVWDTPVVPLADKGPYYAINLTTSVIATMHSLKLDQDFHVTDQSGRSLQNLFAVGELTYGNYFFEEYGATGTAIAFGLYGGTLAARQAVKELGR